MIDKAVTQSARVGILQFPGSNCDMDCISVFRRHFNIDLIKIWHEETALPNVQGLIIPGGFSYGDYLRSGSLASHSPIMKQVQGFAADGGSIIGICNGFQILTESHLLPGILLRNLSRKFICKPVNLRVEDGESRYHRGQLGNNLTIPIAHGEGRYYIDTAGLKSLIDNQQIVFKYASPSGAVSQDSNPNGSLESIAGICSKNGRVLGLMPHPERATDVLLGSDNGLLVWRSFLATFL
jgi:phosphoribosylformylglycinamidine synthase